MSEMKYGRVLEIEQLNRYSVNLVGKDYILNAIQGFVVTEEISALFPFLRAYTYAFVGKAGTGKTTMTLLFAKTLVEQGYECIYLTSNDVQQMGEEEFEKILSVEKKVVVIEDLDYIDNEKNLNKLESILRNPIRTNDSSVVLVTATDATKINTRLFALFFQIILEVPKKEERREFWKETIYKSMPVDMKIDELVDMTEDFSYKDMNNVCILVSNIMIGKLRAKVTEQEIKKMFDEKEVAASGKIVEWAVKMIKAQRDQNRMAALITRKKEARKASFQTDGSSQKAKTETENTVQALDAAEVSLSDMINLEV